MPVMKLTVEDLIRTGGLKNEGSISGKPVSNSKPAGDGVSKPGGLAVKEVYLD